MLHTPSRVYFIVSSVQKLTKNIKSDTINIMNTVVVSRFTDDQLKIAIEDAVIAELNDRPALLMATGKQQRIIEAYYKVLAETEDEVLALRAAREASYSPKA